MIITIDGQAATKKSPVAYLLANKLGYKHINSGMIYRALALERISKIGKPMKLSRVASISYELSFGEINHKWLGCEVVRNIHDYETVCYKYSIDELYSPEVTAEASNLSRHTKVRDAVVACLKRAVRHTDAVIDGRDTGTIVFPLADVKFFFTAGLDSRASWRHKYEGNKYNESLEQTVEALRRRDIDTPVLPACDAHIIKVDKLPVEALAERLAKCYVDVVINNRTDLIVQPVPPCAICEVHFDEMQDCKARVDAT